MTLPEPDTSPHLYPEAVLAASEALRATLGVERFSTERDNAESIITYYPEHDYGTKPPPPVVLTWGHLRTLLGHLDHMGHLDHLGEPDAPTEPASELQRDPDAASEPDPAALLTEAEADAARDLGAWWGRLCGIVGDGPTRDADLTEAVTHVHALQHTIMAQAAARAMPDTFRLLGDQPPPPGRVRVTPRWTEPVRCLDVSCAHRADPNAMHTCYRRDADLAAREERDAYVRRAPARFVARTPADDIEPPMGIDVIAACVHYASRARWRQVEPGAWCTVDTTGRVSAFDLERPDDWASLVEPIRCQA